MSGLTPKPVLTIYTTAKVIGVGKVVTGYVLINGKFPSYLDVIVRDLIDIDGVPATESINNIYKIIQVESYPKWATGKSMYLPKPQDLQIATGSYGETLLRFTRGGKQKEEVVAHQTDEYWQSYEPVRYLKQ